MSNPNIWAPGTSISANGTMKSESFVAAGGQTVFTLTAFTYAIGTGSLYVFVSGAVQRFGTDFFETSATSFTLAEAVPVDTIVYAIGFTEVSTSVPVVGLTPGTFGPSKYIKTNASGTDWETKTSAGLLADIGAEPIDATILRDADIDVSGGVQGYDVDTAKLDVDQTWTGSQRGYPTPDNDGSFDQSITNNFICTPTGNVALTFTNHAAGQSGFVLFVNTGGYAGHSLAATTKADSNFLATINATGTYLIAYFDNGTNAYVTTTGALA